ncbi:OmpA family protein [Ramlibacter aquaticus]|uniref:OmpA family protein n=1 Tax=Ramlibacter aquaticus TaxID=2780094 RepID=A0ABR9SBG8_9BURK|nr:OmpA family protein [Ramlibacter aquaticus]MBE7939690.1 OmpA family protein [Ramlibacter aquaticus]
MTFKSKSPMVLVAAALALVGPLSVSAQPAVSGGWYAGGSLGRTRVTIDDARITSGLGGEGLGTTGIQNRDSGNGGKLFGGYQINPYFGLEFGYFDLGKFGYTASSSPAGSLTGEMRVKGWDADLVGTLPLMEKLSAFGRVGVTSTRVTDQFSATGAARIPYASATPSQRSTGIKYGIGLNYDLTERLAVRLEGERYRIKDAVGNRGNVDMVSVGLVYHFGVSPASRPVAAVAASPKPIPLSAAAIPQATLPPPPTVPVEPLILSRVSLSADSLFDFDKSALKPTSQRSLDKLANDLKEVQYDTVQVTGHTDRIGSPRYNASLSYRRAAAVRNYLVQTGAVPAQKIVVSGEGEAHPVTEAQYCRGRAPTPALIACLAPDRRVDVEIHGTR